MEAFFSPHGTTIVLVRLFGFQDPWNRISTAVAFSARPRCNLRLISYAVIPQLCELTCTARRACFRYVQTVLGMCNRDGTCAVDAPHVAFLHPDVRGTALC